MSSEVKTENTETNINNDKQDETSKIAKENEFIFAYSIFNTVDAENIDSKTKSYHMADEKNSKEYVSGSNKFIVDSDLYNNSNLVYKDAMSGSDIFNGSLSTMLSSVYNIHNFKNAIEWYLHNDSKYKSTIERVFNACMFIFTAEMIEPDNIDNFCGIILDFIIKHKVRYLYEQLYDVVLYIDIDELDDKIVKKIAIFVENKKNIIKEYLLKLYKNESENIIKVKNKSTKESDELANPDDQKYELMFELLVDKILTVIISSYVK